MSRLETRPLQCCRQSLGGEMDEVAWHVEMQPLRPSESRLPTGEIWQIRNQSAASSEPLGALFEQHHRLTDMLQHMEHDDEIKPRVRRETVDRGCDNLYPEGATSRFRDRLVALDSEDAPAALVKRSEHQAGAAADL